MKFRKCGLIYCPNGEHEWEVHSFMTPTPVLIDNDTIRIWGGVRDKNGISRIKYIDVSAQNPKKILYVLCGISACTKSKIFCFFWTGYQ